MRNVFIGIAAVLVVIAALLPLIIVFFIPDWIAGMQAAAVAYVSAFACVGALLFIVVVGLLALIAFQLRNNVVPLLEKATQTMQMSRAQPRSSARAWCSQSSRLPEPWPAPAPWCRR